MILCLRSGGRVLLVDNKRRMLKYYGKAGDFHAPGSDVRVLLAPSGPVGEEKKRGVFLSWDEFVRRLN